MNKLKLVALPSLFITRDTKLPNTHKEVPFPLHCVFFRFISISTQMLLTFKTLVEIFTLCMQVTILY